MDEEPHTAASRQIPPFAVFAASRGWTTLLQRPAHGSKIRFRSGGDWGFRCGLGRRGVVFHRFLGRFSVVIAPNIGTFAEKEFNMNSRAPLRFIRSAFTLVELLTVIAIIAILMGLLFPALQIVKDQANKVKAKTDVVNTVAAVKQYYTEYGKYPLSGVAQTGVSTSTDYVFGDTNSVSTAGTPNNNNLLYDILRNYPNGTQTRTEGPSGADGNPRQIVFFEGRNGISTSGMPRSGFAGQSTGGTGILGCFYDPWGAQYAVSVDANYDNYVPVPYQDFPAPSGSGLAYPSAVNVGCAAWSIGKDGVCGSTIAGGYYKSTAGIQSDDVISWQ
jgi:prepilin-type N-terminal cleavage/methylation domain-containing protein